MCVQGIEEQDGECLIGLARRCVGEGVQGECRDPGGCSAGRVLLKRGQRLRGAVLCDLEIRLTKAGDRVTLGIDDRNVHNHRPALYLHRVRAGLLARRRRLRWQHWGTDRESKRDNAQSQPHGTLPSYTDCVMLEKVAVDDTSIYGQFLGSKSTEDQSALPLKPTPSPAGTHVLG